MLIQPNFLKHSIETALTFLYPAQCKVCELNLGIESVPYICDSCWQDIGFIQQPWCEICGMPDIDDTCDACLTRPPRFGKLRTIAIYETSLQQAIHLFKFEKRTILNRYLTQLIIDNLPADLNISEYDYILPVPIHKRRLRERGFNQSVLIAKEIAKSTGICVTEDVLVRYKNTSPQSSLDREARQTNIIGAFRLQEKEDVRGKRLLVFDDVFTTGATVREVVNTLWDADPVEVDVLTLARTINPY